MAERAATEDRRVAGRALAPIVEIVAERGLDPLALVEGTELDPSALVTPPQRLSWHDFVVVLDRVREHVGPGALTETGRRMSASPGIGALSRMASLLASPAAMYKGAPALGLSTLFPMVEGSYTRLGPTTSKIEAHIPSGYAPCAGLFEITMGNFENLPELIGQPPAVVELESDGRRAVFIIEHGVSLTVWARLKTIWKAIFAANSLFEELTQRNTELARQLAASARAKAQADRAVAGQNDLLTAVSHELRTPIGEIRGLVELARERVEDPEARGHLRAALESSARLTRTVDLLIQVAALGEADGDGELRPVDIGPLVHELVEPFTHPDIRSSVRAPADGEGIIRVPIEWVSAILLELVSNAFRFTERGRIDVDVELREGSDGWELHLEVRDTGVGLEPEWVDRVFEPFVQRDSGLKRRAQGLGLGLTMARSLVDRLGGQIRLESAPGAGTTASVSLPVRRATATELEAGFEASSGPLVDPGSVPTEAPSHPPAQDRVRLEPAPGAAQDRLLVVDDNPVNRLFLASLGRRLGYQVTDVDSGEAALDTLSQASFDLVFMDVQMPGLDGLETTERLRTHMGLTQLPIIAVTAQVAPGDEARCRRAGMDAYVPKPVEVGRLRAAVDEALEAAGGRRAERAS